MKIQLSDHFTYSRLLRFVFPSIAMMIFTSIYGIVDGLFISNFVGKTAFAAINLIMPFLMLFGAFGFMIGTGGSALVAMTLGRGEKEAANRYFSMLIWFLIGAGILLTAAAMVLLRPVTLWLGATPEMVEDCVLYGLILLPGTTFFMLQNSFQSFLVTAEKPHFGLYVTVAAGMTNILLDALFVGIFRWGVAGAAFATVISQAVGALVPLFYFIFPIKSLLRLKPARLELRPLLKTFTNGSSEFMTNASLSVVNMLYNFQLMRLVGEDGVSAYGVIMYVNFIFIGIFVGYAVGSAPIIGYHHGAENRQELSGLFKKSLVLMGASGLLLTAVSIALAGPLSAIFVGYDPALLALTRRAFALYSVSFLVMGFNIFGSAFFTALNNGLVSALISFLRTLLFQLAAVLLLPVFFGVDGVWFSITAAECCALLVTLFFFSQGKERYGYM